jgi:hypothetical protein
VNKYRQTQQANFQTPNGIRTRTDIYRVYTNPMYLFTVVGAAVGVFSASNVIMSVAFLLL